LLDLRATRAGDRRYLSRRVSAGRFVCLTHARSGGYAIAGAVYVYVMSRDRRWAVLAAARVFCRRDPAGARLAAR